MKIFLTNCLLIITFSFISGCATSHISYKSEFKSRSLEYISIDSISNTYIDNDTIYMCFTGRKIKKYDRKIIHTSKADVFTAIINEYDNLLGVPIYAKSRLISSDIIQQPCNETINISKAKNLPIYISATYSNSDFCKVSEWAQDENITSNKNIDSCELTYPKGYTYLFESLHKKHISNGTYVISHNNKISSVIFKKENGVFQYSKISRDDLNKKEYPYIMLLAPFTLVFDIITSPIQLIYFITHFKVG